MVFESQKEGKRKKTFWDREEGKDREAKRLYLKRSRKVEEKKANKTSSSRILLSVSSPILSFNKQKASKIPKKSDQRKQRIQLTNSSEARRTSKDIPLRSISCNAIEALT